MQSANAHLRFPPFLTWGVSGAFWWGAAKCHQIAATAPDPAASLATMGSMLSALVGGALVIRALNSSDIKRDHRRLDKHRKSTAPNHGKSRLATWRDLKKHGLTGNTGVFLGRYRRGWWRKGDIYFQGEGAGLTIGPPGSGKGVCGSQAQLLLNKSSMLVADPKFELFAVTGRHRRENLGHDVILLCPYSAQLQTELGIKLPDAGYNPCSAIIRPGPTLKDDVEMFSSILIPIPPNADAKSAFFMDAAQQFTSAAMMSLVSRGERITLPAIRRWLMASPPVFKEQLIEMTQSMAFNGVLREMGGKLLSTLINAGEEHQGGLSTAIKSLRIFDNYGPMGAHVSTEGFDPAQLKARRTTVYFGLPSEYLSSHALWTTLVFSTIVEAVARDRSTTPVVILADELSNLGYIPNLLQTISLYRGNGLRVHGYIQQTSQIKQLYGDQGWANLIGQCAFVQTFGTTEQDTLKLLSAMAGTTSVETVSQNVRPASVGGVSHADVSFTQSYSSQPTLRPEDIKHLDSNLQLLFVRNMPPLIAEKVDVRSRRRWRSWLDHNPYYRTSKP